MENRTGFVGDAGGCYWEAQPGAAVSTAGQTDAVCQPPRQMGRYKKKILTISCLRMRRAYLALRQDGSIVANLDEPG